MGIGATTNIETLIDGVIGREGGYNNHPADRGGPTRWGVTQQVARAYGYTGDMRMFPRDHAIEIYRRAYWIEPGFQSVALRYPKVAELLFDIGVNMGVSVAATFLQRTLNVMNDGAKHYPDVTIDSRVGPMTLAALDGFRRRRAVEGEGILIGTISSLRGARFVEISEARPANEAFTYGWMRRLVEMVARFA